MNTVTIRVPVSKELKEKAEAAAREHGYASLQETIRAFLTRFTRHDVSLRDELPPVRLSKRSEKRYEKISHDIEAGKNVTTTKGLDELFKLLNS